LKNLARVLEKCISKLALWIRIHLFKISEIEVYDIIVLAAVLAYGTVFSYFTLLKHNVFQSYAWDLGIFDQALYTSLHGRFLYHTAELYMVPSGCFFASHFSPILLLLLPFYAMRPSSTTLLILKSFVLALGAFPLYFFASKYLESKKMGMLLALLYLLYPPLQGANWFDFQPLAFLPLLVFSSYYFMKMKRWKLFFLAISLALMIEEHVTLVLFALSACLLLNYRKTLVPAIRNRRVNEALVLLSTMVFCVVWFILALYVKRSFVINEQFVERFKAVGTYDVLGVEGDPLLLPVYVLLNPGRALEAIAYDYPIKFLYMVLLFGPLLFLSFRSKLSFGILALLAPCLLSNYWAYYTIGSHYPLYLLPLIFLAAVDALKRFQAGSQIPILKTGLMVTVLFIASTSPLSPLSASFGVGDKQLFWYPEVDLSTTEHTESMHKLLQLIPPETSVLTQNHLFPHVSARVCAYVVPPIPRFENDTDYLRDLIDWSDYILLDTWAWDAHTATVFNETTKNDSYGVYALSSKSVLFRRGYQATPILVNYVESRFFQASKDLRISFGQTVSDNVSRSGAVVVIPMEFEGFGVWGPYANLLPGTYNITYTIKAQDNTNEQIAVFDVCYNYGHSIVATRELLGSELTPREWTNITLAVTFAEITPHIEFRVWTSGVTDLYVDGAFVMKVSDP